MSAEPATYLDASALVKLIVAEAESAALRGYLEERPRPVSSTLARVEVVRAARVRGPAAAAAARSLLDRLELLVMDDHLLDAAAELADPVLRSLDAIHVAAAATFAPELEALVTYDRRMADAARGAGLPVVAPA